MNQDIPVPQPCAVCAARRKKRNPYDRVTSVLRWTWLALAPVALVGLIVGFAVMVVWGAQNGQYETVEVTKVVEEEVNGSLVAGTILGTFVVIGAVVGLLFWASKVKEAFDDRRLAWEREQREDR